MIESTKRGKVPILAELSKRLIIFLIILPAFGIAHADEIYSPLLIHDYQPYYIESETVRIVTAYNAGDPGQTDDTPCISANGENICKALAAGQKRCAANFVPLGSRIYIDKIGVFTSPWQETGWCGPVGRNWEGFARPGNHLSIEFLLMV